MTWTYLEQCTSSQEPVEVSSQTYCWDTDPCALLKSNPIADRYYSNANGTTSCHDSQSGTMSAPLTEPSGEERSMSYAEGSLAKTSQRRERVKESQELGAGCGLKWRESLAKYDPSSHSLKTHPCLFPEDSTESYAILPKWGTMRDGECWELPALVATPNVPDCGWWPAPTTKSGGGNCGGSGHYKKAHRLGRYVPRLINPNLYEWLMGWPTGYTDLMPVETGKFQQWLRLHGKS